MTWVALDDLVAEVRVTLDENAVQSPYIGANADNLELDGIIRAKLPEAARDVTETASVELLEPVPMGTTVSTREGGGVLSIPDDFLRLVSLRMKGWNRSVTVAAAEGSDIDRMQRNKYTRGTATKPVCVLSHDDSGKKILEYFGASDAVEKALYMPLPNIETRDGVEKIGISILLKQAIVRRAAGLTLLSRGETEAASAYLQ